MSESEVGANNGDDLIVDFSDRRRPSDTVGDDEETATTKINKQVSFSEDISILSIPVQGRGLKTLA
jgi:hypothetical protein